MCCASIYTIYCYYKLACASVYGIDVAPKVLLTPKSFQVIAKLIIYRCMMYNIYSLQRGHLMPPVLKLRIMELYVPLRYQLSASGPHKQIVYIVHLIH